MIIKHFLLKSVRILVKCYVKEKGVIILVCIHYEKHMTIISQNLYNYRKKNIKGLGQVDSYRNHYKANVYAFQEYPEWGRGKTFYTTFYDNGGENKGNINEVERLWNKYFPWADFPQRYWAEVDVYFENVKIKIINVHITSAYQDQLRFVLLNRLEQLVNERVILLGDFNAAFSYQTENVFLGSDLFLKLIIDRGYKEIYGKTEDEKNPCYTYALKPSNTELWEKKKLDHIFVSSKLEEQGWKMYIEYIDDVNINLVHINGKKPADAFTDHSGLSFVIDSENT